MWQTTACVFPFTAKPLPRVSRLIYHFVRQKSVVVFKTHSKE